MWHDCDSNCDSASGERRARHADVKKPPIFVARAILSTGADAFFAATVAAMQHNGRTHSVAQQDGRVDAAARESVQAASPAASFALSA
jgi:hypothetical protein